MICSHLIYIIIYGNLMLSNDAKDTVLVLLVSSGTAREWTEEELERTAKAVGYGAVKYVPSNYLILFLSSSHAYKGQY